MLSCLALETAMPSSFPLSFCPGVENERSNKTLQNASNSKRSQPHTHPTPTPAGTTGSSGRAEDPQHQWASMPRILCILPSSWALRCSSCGWGSGWPHPASDPNPPRGLTRAVAAPVQRHRRAALYPRPREASHHPGPAALWIYPCPDGPVELHQRGARERRGSCARRGSDKVPRRRVHTGI